LRLGFGFMASKILLSAVGLGLFSELAAAPLDADTIGRHLSLHPRGLRDFLDALVALGMLERSNGLYSNTPETALFLDRAKPGYIGGILEMLNARLYNFFGSLTEALQTGQPQNEAKHGGPNPFDQLYSDPARLRQFLGAMTGISLGSARALAAQFPWKGYRTFADVGCAQGGCPVQVALANPHLTGLGFDLPQVQPIFEEYVASFGLSDRLRFQTGSFFDDPLPSVDVLVMGHVLHDWDLETKRMLLRKAYAALPANGALIVYETIIDDDRRHNANALMMSLNMLIETPGGFDFTGADCSQWMKDAGFRETRVEHLAGPESMVIGIK
jgi:precorrin-6B methylase 2